MFFRLVFFLTCILSILLNYVVKLGFIQILHVVSQDFGNKAIVLALAWRSKTAGFPSLTPIALPEQEQLLKSY